MSRKVAIIISLAVICAITILLLGCPPSVVRVRPPEPRMEVYGTPPNSDVVWRPGHWAYRGGDWVWVPGRWTRPPRPHAHWVPGYWEPRRGGWVWIEGHWEH
jgi:hypothetical protein